MFTEGRRNIEKGLKKMEWELHDLEFVNGIEKRKGPLSPFDFFRDYVSRNKPVVLTNCVETWPCLTKWTKEYLENVLKSKQIPVALTPNGKADSVFQTYDKKGEFVECFVEPYEAWMSFDDFLKRLSIKSSASVSYLQHQNDSLRTLFPDLCDDLEPLGLNWANEAFNCEPEAVNLWIGDERSLTSFHKDHYENIYIVLEGTKEFTLLPPCSSYRLYFDEYPHAVFRPDANDSWQTKITSPRKMIQWSPVDLQFKDKWPLLFSKELPSPLHCSVRKGEVLYLPSLWYHHVEQHNDGDWVIAVNYWYDMAFDSKFVYHQFLKETIALIHHSQGG